MPFGEPINNRLRGIFRRSGCGGNAQGQVKTLNSNTGQGTFNSNSGKGSQIVSYGSSKQHVYNAPVYNFQAAELRDYEYFQIFKVLEHAKLASYNSARERPLTPCFEGTRTSILANIKEWAENTSSPQRVFWLKGSLGTGKTTIAYSIAKFAQDTKILGANFFFSRYDNTLRDPHLLFPTIALQLAKYDPALTQAIAKAIMTDQDVAHRQPEYQFEVLVRHAIASIQNSRRPMLFVFDGIDEFESTIGSYQDIMRLFIIHLSQLSPNVRIFVTSRPEPYIDRILRSVPTNHLKFQDIDHDLAIRDDVTTFLRNRLAVIPDELGLPVELHSDELWFSEDQLRRLSRRAGRSFIYATLALRFIADPVARDPPGQLDLVLEAWPSTSSPRYSEPDQLYMMVLQRAFPPGTSEAKLSVLRSVLSYIVLRCDCAFIRHDAKFIAEFIQSSPREVTRCLVDLNSIIKVEEDGDLHPYWHPSLKNFLTDSTRCNDDRFRLDPMEHDFKSICRCFEIMETHYNSSNINRIQQKLPSSIAWCGLDAVIPYACRHWADHAIRMNPEDVRIVNCVITFLHSDNFAKWLYDNMIWSTQLPPNQISSLLILCTWNCALKVPVLAALRQAPPQWKNLNNNKDELLWFDEYVGLDPVDAGYGFIEDGCIWSPSNSESKAQQTDRCNLREGKCRFHDQRAEMAKTFIRENATYLLQMRRS